jgi:mitochondrial fission protein ELM1
MAIASGLRKVLILSDGKPGHLNQSLAFARLLGYSSEVREVILAGRCAKARSYLYDRLGLARPGLFGIAGEIPPCCAVVSAGSNTYYANKVLAKRLGVPAVAIMLPRGYRYDFDLIVAQEHDLPPRRRNILALPVNLSWVEPQGLVKKQGTRPCVALIIGGPSRHFRMDPDRLQEQVERIFGLFPHADLLLTTSRRTPATIEAFLEKMPFRYRIIYSREPVNPIPDFLGISDYVFVTEDSTSMISEAVSFGHASVEVLPLPPAGGRNKVGRMVTRLAGEGYLHRFDGNLGDCHRKFDLRARLQRMQPCG